MPNLGKKVNGRKRHLLVDTLGLLLTVVVTKANVSDKVGLKRLLTAISNKLSRLELIKADEGYRGERFGRELFTTYQRLLEIVKRPEGVKGFQLQAQRWIVERTLAQVSITDAGTMCLPMGGQLSAFEQGL